MKKENVMKLAGKVVIFSIIGVFFWLLTPNTGYAIYATLMFGAFLWLFYELILRKERIYPAILLGIFLMLFDWIFENLGAVYGLWTTHQSQLLVWSVPIEIMIVTLVGGTAWAMHLPKKIKKEFVIIESLIFAFFGSLGEYLLIQNYVMVYSGGWISAYAFISYFISWLILFWIWKIISKKVH